MLEISHRLNDKIKLFYTLNNSKPNNADYYKSSNEIKLAYKDNNKEKYSYSIILENNRAFVMDKLSQNYEKIDVMKKKINNLLDKYINLAPKLIRYNTEKEINKFVTILNEKTDEIEGVSNFENLEAEYNKLKTQINQFINFYNNSKKDKIPEEEFLNLQKIELNAENILQENKEYIKILLEKYINLAKKLSSDKEGVKFINYFKKLLSKIDKINGFEILNKKYDKLTKTIKRFISHYNRRINNKILEEEFLNLQKVELNTENISQENKEYIKILLEKYINLAEELIEYTNDQEARKFATSFNEKIDKITEISNFGNLESEYNKLKRQISQFISFYNKRVESEYKKILDENFIDAEEIESDTENITQSIPNVIFHNMKYYKRLKILKNQINEEKQNFFTHLLKNIDNGIDNIEKAYSNTATYKNNYENLINEFIEKNFSKKFNELAGEIFGKHEYDFKIRLGGEEIWLSLKIDDENVYLCKQSLGFQLFFKLFFDLYCKYDLQIGDIVLIDEPDARLSISSKIELREIMKKIAKEKGITFVVTTHSPFFVDIDYLDEIRIVKRKADGDGVEIVNFGDIDTHTEADSLKQIIEAFGLGNLNRDIITNPNNKVIFVEGITDYNYLTAFKKLYENQNNGKKLNLSFLPIAGLGKLNEYGGNKELKNKTNILSKFKDVIILTDGDNTANKFKELSEEKINVIQLIDIDPDFKKIESLFSESDKEKFKSVIKNKSFETSSLFKNIILDLDKELNEQTINNFNKVLVFLNTMS